MRGRLWIIGLVMVFGGCVSDDQERVRDYNQEGVYLFGRGEFGPAREEFQAALVLRPEDPVLYYNLGQCYDRVGDGARAERSYLECLARAPNQPECRHALTVLLVRTNRRDDAVRMVQDWLSREPKLPGPYAEDGWLAYQAGDLPKAQSRLQQALELDPHDTRALIELARVYETMQRPDRAIALYERVLERRPNQVELVSRINQLRKQGAKQPQPD